MTRRALLLLACAAILLAARAVEARKENRAKPAPPAVAEPERKMVRTILFDSRYRQHPTFEQRWAGESK